MPGRSSTRISIFEPGLWAPVNSIYVYNKSDLAGMQYPLVSGDNIWIAAKEGVGLDELLQMIRKQIFSDYVTCQMIIPYDEGAVVSYLNEEATILATAYEEQGTLLTLELKQSDYNKYERDGKVPSLFLYILKLIYYFTTLTLTTPSIDSNFSIIAFCAGCSRSSMV